MLHKIIKLIKSFLLIKFIVFFKKDKVRFAWMFNVQYVLITYYCYLTVLLICQSKRITHQVLNHSRALIAIIIIIIIKLRLKIKLTSKILNTLLT